MSELQRAFAKAKLSGLPPVIPNPLVDIPLDEEDEETDGFGELLSEQRDDDSSSASSASSASSTGTIRPSHSNKLFARPFRSASRSNSSTLTPISWTSYFERTVQIPHTTTNLQLNHHVYLTSPVGEASKPGPLFIAHHGAGSNGLTFALLARAIKASLPNAGFMSIDARGHGLTTTTPLPGAESTKDALDFSLEAFTDDLITVIKGTKEAMHWPTMPPIILIGHSLGGSVVTSVAESQALGNDLLGYVVLDIVEQTALEALSSMAGYLRTRPSHFPSVEAGIEWHLRSGGLKVPESARVSVPPLLVADYHHDGKVQYDWRTNLGATSPWWNGWFEGLSKRFLQSRGGKLLLLAGTERLDKEMMIGQMQGKYALQIFPEAGHFLHEDCAEKTAQSIIEFYKRNDRSALVLPPKVSDMLKAGKKV